MNHANLIGKVAVGPHLVKDSDGSEHTELVMQLVTQFLGSNDEVVTKTSMPRVRITGRWLKVQDLLQPGENLAVEGTLEHDADQNLFVLVNDLIIL
jgi:hypothetical protein